MECKFAYMKQHIDYVLCSKEPEPDRHNRTAVFHAMCGHQVNCPKENCHKLTATWRNCVKLVEPAEPTYEDVFPDAGEDPELVKQTAAKPRKAKKSAESA